jgi:hypothetical protein
VSEDDIILWQDLLDLVMAGRTSNLKCPFCEKGQVEVKRIHRVTRLECPSCRKFIEGSLGDE